MFWPKIPVLVAANTAEDVSRSFVTTKTAADVPTSNQKYPFLALRTTGICPVVSSELSSGFMFINVRMP